MKKRTLARWLLWISILGPAICLSTVRAENHGADVSSGLEDKDEDAVTAPPGSSSYLFENSGKGHGRSGAPGNKPDSGSGKNGPGPNAKGAAKDDGTPARAIGYPVFLFADGPRAVGDLDPHAGEEISLPIRALIKRSIPGARILRVAPLTTERLADAWRVAKKQDPDNTALITSALLIVNAKANAGPGGLQLLTVTGTVAEPKWRDAIDRLSRSIFDTMPSGPNERPKLETILLTADAGAIDCRRFPGPVFGMTQEGQPREIEQLQTWLTFQEKPDSFFPTTAREWFDGWTVTRRINDRRYFYCPMNTTRGYLGAMRAGDIPP